MTAAIELEDPFAEYESNGIEVYALGFHLSGLNLLMLSLAGQSKRVTHTSFSPTDFPTIHHPRLPKCDGSPVNGFKQ